MGEFVRGRYLDVQNKQKNRYTFLGILQGVTCDGDIRLSEIYYILDWLKKHAEGIDDIPNMQKIRKLLNLMASKQIVVDSDELELKNLLNGITGSQWETTNDTINVPVNLYKKNPSIVFAGCCFVLSGVFEYGAKKECEELIESFGGICNDNVTAQTDYLIVGNKGSKDWTHNSWGTKIEKANKTKVTIISEVQWLDAIKRIE